MFTNLFDKIKKKFEKSSNFATLFSIFGKDIWQPRIKIIRKEVI